MFEFFSSLLISFTSATIFSLLTLFTFGFYLVYQNYQKVQHIPGVWQLLPFGPFRIPFLSPYIYIGNQYDLCKVIEAHGDKETKTLRISTLFGNVVIVSDREMLKQVHSKQLHVLNKDPRLKVTEIFGESLVSAPDTARWKKHHRVLSAAFTSGNLEFMCRVAVKTVDQLTRNKWDVCMSKSENGTMMLEPYQDFTNVTLDVLAKSVFGTSFCVFPDSEQSNPDLIATGRQLKQAIEKIFTIAFPIRMFLGWFPLLEKVALHFSGAQQGIECCSKVLDECIEERRTRIERGEEISQQDLLSLMVKANMENNELTMDHVKSNGLLFFVAGTETSSNTLQWIIYELAKRPEIQKRAQQEVDQILNNGQLQPSFQLYDSFIYCNAIIHETLRCHPPVGSISKICIHPHTLLGKFEIPKGTIIHSLITQANKNEQVWPHLHNTFHPDRFLNVDELNKRHSDYSMIPFSMGLRKCIGYKFALFEMLMVLTRLIQNYEFELLNDENVNPVLAIPDITFKPYGMKVRVSKRRV
ncbi:hypothetical protein C9374_001522 [Naegleria lovaniensis]|uniref:Cytochrome P450 n=1 Tax=Naegleria lovaniensis TaxID=51637 RepID=A0AA88KKV2_NAELO|nr:uncharacterized protein C9374_001522 [Naegleria lovaniensis]KAG2387190.1 hypothetical protein C9374_001522 [Naegleria lovaniensis]